MHATPKPDLRLGRDRVLRRRTDFAAIKSGGRRLRTATLSLNWSTDWPGGTLTAFIVPKAVGNAVIRNRIRRRLRELYRHVRSLFPPGSATVWIASRGSAKADLPTLARDFLHLCHHAKLLEASQGFPAAVSARWKLPPARPKFSD